MAVDIKKLFKDPGFYFKVIELIIAIVLTVIYKGSNSEIYFVDLSKEILLIVAVPNSIITVSVLLIIYILDKKNNILELCILGASGVLNIGLGTIMLCYISKKSTVYYLCMSSLCLALGIMFLIDFIRLIKSSKELN